ncbi:MAG: hypothetical protein Rubg2KO_18700 [Rubricoccaceae bacterium]
MQDEGALALCPHLLQPNNPLDEWLLAHPHRRAGGQQHGKSRPEQGNDTNTHELARRISLAQPIAVPLIRPSQSPVADVAPAFHQLEENAGVSSEVGLFTNVDDV